MRLLEVALGQVLWAPAGYCTTTLAPDEDSDMMKLSPRHLAER
jgi:hypothetical protein